jgi:hypothetical protein
MEERTKNIYDAIVCVMKEVKNIEKSMTIGSGQNSYKGISDKDVKQKIGESMAKNDLICLPIKIEPTTRVDRWEEVDPWSKATPKAMKTKQSVFTEVLCTYKIIYAPTGEHIEIQGFGYGVDPQDKSAGKATTYALKNALLYSFLVPTGTIEDTDNTHSKDIPVVPVVKATVTDDNFSKTVDAFLQGKINVFDTVRKTMQFTPAQEVEISEILTINNYDRMRELKGDKGDIGDIGDLEY